MTEKKEEFNEDYIYVHWSGYQKKQDVKVVETKKTLNDEEVESYIREKLNLKESFFKIKSDLIEEGSIESRIDDIFIKIIKVKYI